MSREGSRGVGSAGKAQRGPAEAAPCSRWPRCLRGRGFLFLPPPPRVSAGEPAVTVPAAGRQPTGSLARRRGAAAGEGGRALGRVTPPCDPGRPSEQPAQRQRQPALTRAQTPEG